MSYNYEIEVSFPAEISAEKIKQKIESSVLVNSKYSCKVERLSAFAESAFYKISSNDREAFWYAGLAAAGMLSIYYSETE